MIRIETDNKSYELPTSTSECTVETFDRFSQIDLGDIDAEVDLKSYAQVLAALGNIPLEEVLALNHKDFLAILHEVLPLICHDFTSAPPSPTININGEIYLIQPQEKLSFAEWIDADAALKMPSDRLAGLLAVLCRPQGQPYVSELFEERRRFFSSLSIEQVEPILSFYFSLKKKSSLLTNLYSTLKEQAN